MRSLLPAPTRWPLSLCGLALALLVHAPVFAQSSTVSFQGQLALDGAPFDGNAAFKFVVLCGTGSAWSNDGTSSSGSEPTSAVTLPVEQGVFSVLLGDPALSMVPLTADLLRNCTAPALRMWVDTGTGFEQFTDQALASTPFALVADAAKRAPGGFTVTGTLKIANAQGQATVSADGASGQISANSIRFGDGTVQTTAGGGSSGPDGDWVINGNDMYAGVNGAVGIGTNAPDRPLQVQGGSDINATLAGGALRIGSSTGESILFDGNEIQAVDTGAPGGLAFNVEGGNVGIGVVNGATKLHVVGDVRSDGLEAGGFETHNPNNLSAVVKMGWFNDVARFRVGGSGTGALNGFDFQTTSDLSRLRILNNGNVGIGTTTPTQKLEVAGNMLVQGDLVVDGAFNVGGISIGSGILSIPPNAFQPDDHLQTFTRTSLYYYGGTAGQGVTIEAPVYLPHGATITEFRVVLTDNYSPTASGSNIQTFLTANPLSGATGTIIATLATTGAPGRITLTATGLSHVVDNANNVYSVSANWVTPPSGGVSLMRVNGMRIQYTAN